MNFPLMTVLMPVYNADSFLGEAIESILNQTFTNFEFIIIDDGSDDNSQNIILSFDDNRIRYFKNEKNEGITYSLNKGIGLAKAQLIARMDADDIAYPQRLQQQYDFIKENPDGALYSCGVIEVDEQRRFLKKENFHYSHFYYNLTFSTWIYHSTMVYRKDCVDAVGRYTVPYAEDWELVWQLSRRYKIYHQPEVLLEYRVSSKSLCMVTKKQEYLEATLQQAQRNIRSFTKNEDPVSLPILKALINVDDVAVERYSLYQVLKCLKTLDQVTGKILQLENVNKNQTAIQYAAKNKRDYMVAVFCSRVGPLKKILLLFLTGNLRTKILKSMSVFIRKHQNVQYAMLVIYVLKNCIANI